MNGGLSKSKKWEHWTSQEPPPPSLPLPPPCGLSPSKKY